MPTHTHTKCVSFDVLRTQLDTWFATSTLFNNPRGRKHETFDNTRRWRLANENRLGTRRRRLSWALLTQHRLSLSLLAAHLCILPEDLIWHSEIPRQPEPKAAHVFSYLRLLRARHGLQRHLLQKITTTLEQWPILMSFDAFLSLTHTADVITNYTHTHEKKKTRVSFFFSLNTNIKR